MKEMIDEILAEVDARNNPYFTALGDGTFDKEDFVETQIQFYYAVVFFSRPMAVIAAKIPSAAMRVEVMRNVWEEHGEGDEDKMHGETFKVLLDRLGGIRPEDIERRVLWPEIRAFNTTLIGCAVADDWEAGTACFGIIERMFSAISNWIGKAIVDRGWLSREQLTHYNIHELLDIKHSDDFFDVLAEGGKGDPRAQYCIEQGMRMGAYVFNELYAGLFNARRRRLFPDVHRPQGHIYRG